MSLRNHFLAYALFLFLILGCTPFILGQVTYSVRAVRRAGATFQDAGGGINNAGQIAGYFLTKGKTAYLWTNGSWQLLGPGIALGLNDSGYVVGISTTSNHAILWKKEQSIDLGVLTLGDSSAALGINKANVVVGYDLDTSGLYHAFRWTNTAGIKRLPDLVAGPSQATHVNVHGTIFGWSEDSYNFERPAIWKNGKVSEMVVFDVNTALGISMNDNGDSILQVPPIANIPGGSFIYSQGGGSSIDIIPNFTGVFALALNNSRTVVGYQTDAQSNQHAFICFARLSYDLNSLISAAAQKNWVLQSAQGINDQGQIVGYGTYKGTNVVFLLTPSGALSDPSCY